MATNQTIEMQIKSSADGALNSINKLKTSLNGVESKLGGISNAASKFTRAFSLGSTYYAVKKLTSAMVDFVDNASDYSEQLNLFNVVFDNMKKNGVQTYSELGQAAIKYQNTLNEKFGTSMKDTLYYQALYQSMGESSGITDKYNAILSQTVTNLTYDLASLFNKNEKDTAESLRAGIYAGQTKPLRAYGIDVTETTLNSYLAGLGIDDRTVSQMSQAEKQILRYIAALKQAQNALGDYANTIESPANQMKVFNNLVTEAKVAVSSLFIGTFAKILPYANALLMVIKEVSKAIATLFGIEISDYNTGIASSEDAYSDLTDQIDDATASAKKLKLATLGFDEIHNISEATDSSSGSAVSGGIDQRLLDAITSYDNGLGSVSMKASEIRDKIMEWLGFTKIIDEITGEVSFKFTDSDSALARIAKSVKDIFDSGKKIVEQVVSKIVDDLKNGWLGEMIAKPLEVIAKAMEAISENTAFVDFMTTILEILVGIKLAIEIIKGLGIITGIGSITKAIGGLSGAASTAVGTGTAVGAATGLTGLLLTLGALATVWVITLKITQKKVVSEAISSITNDIESLTDNAKEMTDKLKEVAEGGEISANSFNVLSHYLSQNIGKMSEENETVEKLKGKFKETSDEAQQLTEGQKQLSDTTRMVKDTVYDLYKKEKITKDMFEQFMSSIGAHSPEMDNLASSTQNASNKTEALKDNLALLPEKAKDSSSRLNDLKTNAEKLGESSKISSSKINGLKNEINGLNSKTITLDIDANMEKAKSKLENLFNYYGFGSGGSGGGFRANGGSYYGGNWHSIKQYANGGSPTHGTMFVAGEAGAEVVGNINGRTEVLNQSQMASAIYSAVVSAMSNSGNGGVEVYLHTDEGVVVDRINQKTRQTGVCPINIPY